MLCCTYTCRCIISLREIYLVCCYPDEGDSTGLLIPRGATLLYKHAKSERSSERRYRGRPHAPALFKGVMPLKTFITCKAFLAGDGHAGQIIWLIMHEYEEARRAAETPGTL